MELDITDSYVQEEIIPNTKQSRLIRKEQIEIKQSFHKKNPKSIQYYENLKKEPSMAKEDTLVQEIAEKNETINHNENSPTKAKLKNQLQLMFHSLEKTFKRDGIFFQSNKQFNKIHVFKDYNVPVYLLKDKKHTLGLRCEIGVWEDFLSIVTSAPQDYSNLLTQFNKWLQKSIQDYYPQKIAQEFFETRLLNNPDINEKISPQLLKLEENLIKNLRKPGKQPNGFINKGESIYLQWLEQAQEIHHIEQIETKLNFKSYEQTFDLARKIKRKFSIFIGPTNSGKTYQALNELTKAKTGLYLAPLRLMAAEGQEALFERGIVTSLLTGEEQKIIEEATHISSTIEMCNLSKKVDVAVIDEIQMISDKSRGWAWSQALIGLPAKHIVLVGSQEALPFIIPVIENLGEEYEIKTFERKAPLTYRDPMWKLKDLKAGDCVVVFSRKNALEMKNLIEATGKKCSVIYGNLSPDVRRVEANKFKNGDNPILVATDAIGMGLNLPINRLFFSTLQKFDGEQSRLLTISEIKQIAGRAGRFGLTQTGEVGLLTDNNFTRNELLKKAIYMGYETADDTRISIAPNLSQIKTICDVLGKEDLYSALIFFKEKLIKQHDIYKASNLDSMIEIAALLKSKKLPLDFGFTYACVPIDLNSDLHVKLFHSWINNHLKDGKNLAPSLPDVITYKKTDSYSLYEAENFVKICMAYRWLHYKFPSTFTDIDTVTKNARTANNFIEKSLHQHITISKAPRGKYR